MKLPAFPKFTLPQWTAWQLSPVVFLAVVAALIVAPRPQSGPLPDKDTAYTSTVNALFDAGYLEGSLDRHGANKVGITPACHASADCLRVVRAFALQSYLKDDMKRADGDAWASRGRKITALQAFTRIYYDNDSDHAVVPPRIVYAQAGYSPDAADYNRVQLVDLDRGRSCDLAPGETRAVQDGVCGTPVPSGCNLTLTTLTAGGYQSFAVSLAPQGCALLYADGTGPTDHAPITTGTLIRIEGGSAQARPQRLMITGMSDTIAASDSLGVRYYDHGFTDLARYLERSAPQLLPELDSPNVIALSLHRSLNLRAAGLLQGQMRPLLSEAHHNILAGAVLMDGVTGEVAALPTFPFVRDDLLDSQPGDDPRLDRNVNFMNLSIGSAAKVPFATAIVSRWPALRAMKVADNDATVGKVLGYPGTFESHVHGAPVDFTRFISESSNRYAMTLMAAGLRKGDPFDCAHGCRPISGEQGVWLGDRRITAVRPPDMKNPHVGGEWSGNLQSFFDIDPANCLKSPKPGSLTLWGERRLGQAYELNAPPLCLTQVDNVTPDYYMATLGGSRSLWSTLMLAQSYARIVSNQKIEATLLARDRFRDGHRRAGFPGLGIDPAVHADLLTGLKGTLTEPRRSSDSGLQQSGGTGGRLISEGTLCNTKTPDSNYIYTCYAKTGTGRINEKEQVHSLALIVEKSATAGGLCTRSVFAINIQYRRADATPAITYAISLLKDAEVRRWLDRPCTR